MSFSSGVVPNRKSPGLNILACPVLGDTSISPATTMNNCLRGQVCRIVPTLRETHPGNVRRLN